MAIRLCGEADETNYHHQFHSSWNPFRGSVCHLWQMLAINITANKRFRCDQSRMSLFNNCLWADGR
jgi:hypothetical protein